MRNHHGLLATAFLAAVALSSSGLGSVAGAAENSPVASKNAERAPVTSGSLTLLKSKMVHDNAQAALAAGFQPIDPGTTLVCPAGNRCTISAEQNVQIRSAAANNDWAICTQVNGVFMTRPSCPFLGTAQVGVFDAESFEQSAIVGPGTHTVRTFLFTDFGATRSIYHIEYAIYRGL